MAERNLEEKRAMLDTSQVLVSKLEPMVQTSFMGTGERLGPNCGGL